MVMPVRLFNPLNSNPMLVIATGIEQPLSSVPIFEPIQPFASLQPERHHPLRRLSAAYRACLPVFRDAMWIRIAPARREAYVVRACLFQPAHDFKAWIKPGLLHKYPPGRNVEGGLRCLENPRDGRAGGCVPGKTFCHRTAPWKFGFPGIEQS